MRKIVKNGTIVKVKSDLQGGNTYGNGLYFCNSMEECRGQEFEVVNSDWDEIYRENRFELKGDEGWTWNLDMIEEVSEENMEDLDLRCADCGEQFENEDDLIYIEEYDRYVCQDCYDDNYCTCDDCGRVISNDDCNNVEGGSRCVCDSCFDNYYYCEDCGEYYDYDCMHEDENGNWYCDDCWNSNRSHEICGYHDYPRSFKLLNASGEVNPPFRLGTELEMENDNGVISECIDFLKDNFDAILSHDGSLCSRGAMEWVDDARSLKNHYEVADLKRKAFELLVKNGYRSHDTSTCGLHVHVTRPFQEEINKLDYYNEEDRKKIDKLKEKQEEVIDRIILFMETYKPELIKFSRRKNTDWCRWLSDVVTCDNGKITSLDFIKKVKGESYGHHRALNLENRNTIEFRIFKGTLNFDTYMASIELVNNIVELCSNLEIPIEDITWTKTTNKGQYVKKYVDENNIHTNKKIVDTSASDRIWEIIRNKRKVKIAKKVFVALDKYYNEYTKRFNEIKDSEDWNSIYHTASKLSEFSSQMAQITRYNNEKDYNGLYYKLQETISYNMYFDNEYLEGIRTNLKELVKGLQ